MNSRLDVRSAAAGEATVSARALRIGSSLHGLDYEVVGVVHDGSHGVNYLARHRVGGEHAVIKEYLPSMLAWRAAGGATVVPKAPRHEEAFKAGLRAFTNEARLLASFEHPAVVRVLRYWKENGTAYMAMPVLDGATLRRVVTEHGAAPDEAELRRWLAPVLDGLDALHAAHCVHGDLSPDSLMITRHGPVLLGFGGGRQAIGTALRAPTETLRPGYAAPEQYSPDPAPLVGPWTDLYGLAAVLCAAMTGRAPTSAPERLQHDRLEPIATQVGARFTPSLARAVDAALAVPAVDRPQTVTAFRALLDGSAEDAAAATPRRAAAAAPATAPPRVDRFGATLIASAVICVAAFAAIGYLLLRTPDAPVAAPSATSTVPVAVPMSVAVPDPMAPPHVPPPNGSAALVEQAPQPAIESGVPRPPAPPPSSRRAQTETATPAASPAPSPATRSGRECSELIQRASLQTLTPAEAAQLKKECKK